MTYIKNNKSIIIKLPIASRLQFPRSMFAINKASTQVIYQPKRQSHKNISQTSKMNTKNLTVIMPEPSQGGHKYIYLSRIPYGLDVLLTLLIRN